MIIIAIKSTFLLLRRRAINVLPISLRTFVDIRSLENISSDGKTNRIFLKHSRIHQPARCIVLSAVECYHISKYHFTIS